ncbi:GNAT family acetyltransferase [Paecilomyces variotii No. 5]|uniref:GNAT family acetyltransferase n=1 Tax=Byssochlamys spectabilis (strain No. 5 / NBRC 109023) TaxID=1356009 RepID=V5FSQ6_BYSSN|nr:GNAT family acetyltransferase [Paecilomyces variotii No. 5]
MGSTTDYDYTYFRIPKESPDIASYAEKYRQLRLAALQLSPTSFSSTYEIESTFSDQTWIARLTAPEKQTFICVARPRVTETAAAAGTTDNHHEVVSGEWVAQVTILGPLSVADFNLPEESGQPAGSEDEERWQMLSLYTLPAYRGRGIAKDLCREVFRYLATARQEAIAIRVRIMVKPENQATVSMYRNLGFVDAGRCTLAEALRANGDADMVPSDGGGEKFNKRGGLIMTLSLRR